MLQRLSYNDKIFRELEFLDSEVVLRDKNRSIFADLTNVARHFGICDITTLAYGEFYLQNLMTQIKSFWLI